MWRHTIQDAVRLQQELIAPLGRGGFHIRKFCASHPSILEEVPPDCREMDVPIELDSNEGIKTIGLLWHPLLDQFLSKGTCAHRLRESKNSPVSKRVISSLIAAIFYSLGLISPVVVVYKIFLQQLWLHKLDWDEQLPSELFSQWMDMYLRLSQVNEIAVDRLVLAKGQPMGPLGRPRLRWVDNIRMDLQEVECGYMDSIGRAQDRDRWRTLVSAVMNPRVP